jgi:hypothetical protein
MMASDEVRGKGGGECVCVPSDKHVTMHHCHSRGVVVSVGGAAVGITAIHSLDWSVTGHMLHNQATGATVWHHPVTLLVDWIRLRQSHKPSTTT